MTDIVLTTLNAKYPHAAFGLRYLLANLGELRSRACLVEFDIQQRPIDVVEVLLARQPRIVGFGVYIWNVSQTTEVIATLKRVRPNLTVVLGGPEVSFEVEDQQIVRLADYVITGEADLKFAEVCGRLLAGGQPAQKIIHADPPDVNRLVLPYDLYTEEDIANRIIYVEASRGCPFTCEFCLSSLDIPVRQFPLPDFLKALQRLVDSGVRQFKFVDRTFNANLNASKAILEFFLERCRPDTFVHFEMIPDRLPDPLRALITRFPKGSLQFEVGIQTFNSEVSQRIKRRQDYPKLADNLQFLRSSTGVHVHADLIVGLPGESLQSFAAGFDRLIALGPQEIQVGILKRLRGTPIVRHDAEWQMVYNPDPPYEILQTRSIDFATMQRLRRFARYWDLVANSGNFVGTTPLIWSATASPFEGFMRWSDWLFERVGRRHGIALSRLAELLFEFLVEIPGLTAEQVARALGRDFRNAGRREKPQFLQGFFDETDEPGAQDKRPRGLKRQRRRLARAGQEQERQPSVQPIKSG